MKATHLRVCIIASPRLGSAANYSLLALKPVFYHKFIERDVYAIFPTSSILSLDSQTKDPATGTRNDFVNDIVNDAGVTVCACIRFACVIRSG